MRRLEEVLIVEGRYDKNALSQVVDAVILETSGFGIFHDRQKQALLRRLAEQRGLIVLTDSDAAGFVYIPDVPGKERRKSAPSKEGKLGVEGMRPEVLLEALEKAGAHFLDEERSARSAERISKADLYRVGLSGGPGSREKRAVLLRRMDLPERLTADGLLEVLNALMSREDFFGLTEE